MEINFEELTVGKLTERDIVRTDGTLILKEGTTLTPNMLYHLRNLKGTIEYKGEEQEGFEEVEETVDKGLREEAERNITEFLSNPTEAQAKKIKQTAAKIVERTQESEDPQFDLEHYLNDENDKTSHAVRVACFSILLARIYNNTLKPTENKSLINLNDIAVAALLQGTGSIYQDRKKLDELTEVPNLNGMNELFPGIKETPLDHYDERYSSVYSYSAVSDFDSISDSAKLMILLSNEPENGNGPLKLPSVISSKRNSILYGAKIIKVCNIYDNAIKRAIDNENSLENVVAELGQCAMNGEVSNEIKELLINKVKLYPRKTRVMLSSGEVATVETSRVGQYDSYKPVVRTCASKRKIDLKESTNTTIKSIVSKDKFKGLVKQQIEDMKDELTDR